MARATVGVPVAAAPFPSPASHGLTYASQSAATTVTADATSHTPGAWTELIASNSADTDWLFVKIHNMRVSATDTRGLVDLGVGAAASEVAVVSSIPAGYSGQTADAFGLTYLLPLRVAKGSRVTARLQALISADTCIVTAWTLRSAQPGRRSPSSLVTIGADTAASTSSVFMTTSDTYAEITSATTQPFRGLIACHCGGEIGPGWNADNSQVLTLATGASGSEVVAAVAPNMNYAATETLVPTELNGPPPTAVYTGHVPTGTRIATKITTGRAYKGAIVFGVPYA